MTKEVSNLSVDEVLYLNLTHPDSKGRYGFRLPLRDNFALGDSASQALKTFYSLEKRFEKIPALISNTLHS